MTKPLVILRPAPQTVDRIFTAEALEALRAAYEVHVLDEEPGVEERFDALLPRAFADRRPAGPADRAAGPGDRAARAAQRRGQLLPQRGLRDLLRPRHPRPGLRSGVRHRRRRVRAGPRPRPGPRHLAGRTGRSAPAGSATSPPRPPTRSCSPARTVGLVGFGNLGRALHRLLQPFRPTLRVYDPWLPDAVIARARRDAELAAGAAGDERVRLRAGHGDRGERAPAGRRRAGPAAGRGPADPGQPGRGGRLRRPAAPGGRRPVPGRGRRLADRAGARPTTLPARWRAWCCRPTGPAASRPAFAQIGDMVVDDLAQIARGLPPVRMQVASRELVTRYRNRPVTLTAASPDAGQVVAGATTCRQVKGRE